MLESYWLNKKTMKKSVLASWTIWFGALQVLLGAVGMFSGLMDPAESITLLTTGLATIGLRVKTSQPII